MSGVWYLRSMSDPRGCVDDDELADLATGKLTEDDTRAITEHAGACAHCQSRVAAAVTKQAPKTTDHSDERKPARAPEAASKGAARLPLLVGAALLFVIAAGGLASNERPPPASPTVELATPTVSPPFVPHALAAVNDPTNRERVHNAFNAAAAPVGSEAAIMGLLHAAALELDSAARDPATSGESRGAKECLALLDEDLGHLVEELGHVRDRTAVEGAILAARDLEHPSVCRGAGPDPAEAGRDKIDSRSMLHVRMRRPLAVPPFTPGRLDPATKRGLFAFNVVLGALARDPNVFPDSADLRAFDDLLDTMVDKADGLPTKARAGAALADELAGKGLAIALDAGKPDHAADLARALTFAELLAMDALRARLSLFAAGADLDPETKARHLEELAPLVRRVADAPTTTAYVVARMRLDATKGVRPSKDTPNACASVTEAARAACVPILAAAGDITLDREARDVEIEVTTSKAVYGDGHPHYAFAKVHEAEWNLARGNTEAAAAGAGEARAALEASLLHDVNVEVAETRTFSPGTAKTELPRLGAWTLPRALPIGDEAYTKYVHLARAHAVLVATLPESEARAAAKAGRALRGRDDADAVILPVELASTARFSDPTRGYDTARAAAKLAHPVFLARARARAAALESDPEKALSAYASALALVAFLPPPERASLRLAAAKKSKDREVARALLEKALPEASAKDKAAIEAYRDSLR